jgi:GNAT superfamily N-acetyltransferase
MIDFMDQKAQFDRSLTGRPPSKLRATPGNTLQSLFPEVPNGKVVFAAKEVDNDPIGFAMYQLKYHGFAPPLLWLEDIFVDPQKRSGGVGAVLMDELASIGQDYRCSHISWMVDSRNQRGIQFYNQLGATVDGQDGDFYRMKWVPDSWQ